MLDTCLSYQGLCLADDGLEEQMVLSVCLLHSLAVGGFRPQHADSQAFKKEWLADSDQFGVMGAADYVLMEGDILGIEGEELGLLS
jgi:hypothetical protein